MVVFLTIECPNVKGQKWVNIYLISFQKDKNK